MAVLSCPRLCAIGKKVFGFDFRRFTIGIIGTTNYVSIAVY